MPLREGRVGFEKEHRIPTFECDEQRRWAPAYLLRHAQQIATDNTDALGMSYEALFARRQVFLLSRLCLQVERMPLAGELIRMVTVPMEAVRSQFVRSTWFYAEDGSTLAVLDTAWVLVDPESRRILRPSVLDFDFPVQAPCSRPEICRMRVPACAEMEEVDRRRVRYTDLDLNGHMTNTRYADILCDCLPDGTLQQGDITALLLAYEHEAMPGDTLSILRGRGEDGSFCFAGLRGEERCFSASVTVAAR